MNYSSIKLITVTASLILFFCLSTTVNAEQDPIYRPDYSSNSFTTIAQTRQDKSTDSPSLLGLALTFRSAKIPYVATRKTVSDVVPLLFYQNGRFFWRGLEAGYTFADYQSWNVSIIGRQRFFDIPAEFQNKRRGDGTDVGFRYRKVVNAQTNIDVEIMDDLYGRNHANLSVNYHLDSGSWDFLPYATLRFKSIAYNNFYYGLEVERPGKDIDITIGGTLRYHVTSDFYLIGRAALTEFGSKTTEISTMDSTNQSEFFIGFGLFQDKTKQRSHQVKSKPYIRIARGTASPSSIGEIVKFEKEADQFNNTFTSIFYGIPAADSFFGYNIPVYFTPGYVRHEKSVVQQQTFEEYVIALKVFYTITWPSKWRIGFAEGLSYLTKITYIEQTEMDKNNYRASNLLNYLDFSIDLDLGDLFNSKTINGLWAGYSIHHRSGIFETSSSFGRIKGGSNYTSLYLQYHW